MSFYSDDEEIDPLSEPSSYGTFHQTRPLQQLLFPRGRSQVFTPLTLTSPPPGPRYSSSRQYRPDFMRARSVSLLDRSQCFSASWDIFLKSDKELKAIKNRKVREFYADQVYTSGIHANGRTVGSRILWTWIAFLSLQFPIKLPFMRNTVDFLDITFLSPSTYPF